MSACPPVDRRRGRCRRVAVGDVLVRRDEGGLGIFNYRGERVLEARLALQAEAARVAADIVSPWRGRVRNDESGQGGQEPAPLQRMTPYERMEGIKRTLGPS